MEIVDTQYKTIEIDSDSTIINQLSQNTYYF